MRLQQEILFDVIHEVDELLQLHYEEVALHRDRIKLDPMWDQYVALEKLGMLAIYTARNDDGKLIGYSAFFINKHMHYKDTVIAINDVLFLHPDYRDGIQGYRFIKFCHDQLVERGGINKITWHVKLKKDWSKVLHKLGYTDEELVVGIVI